MPEKKNKKQRIIYSSRFIYQLTWEPSVAQGTHYYSCRLPAVGLFFPGKLNFRFESRPIQLRI